MQSDELQIIRIRKNLKMTYQRYRESGCKDAALRDELLRQSRELDRWVYDVMKGAQKKALSGKVGNYYGIISPNKGKHDHA